MKTKRTLIALILTICLTLTSVTVPAFAAKFSDLAETSSAYTAVNVLNKLGVINGYEEDGSLKFKPDNNVTRAEFTAMLLRTRGLGSIGSTSLDNPPFPDVSTPDVSWAIGNIRTAREMGVINGYDDGTFKPNNNVLYEEAVKMIVCALGYGEMGVEGNEWYSKYILSANTLGFLQGAGGAVGVPATRATIASMLYNCLEVKLAENNKITEKTVLENDLQLSKKVGVIASNAETGLETSNPNLREDEVQIRAFDDEKGIYETLTYKVDNANNYKDMLGSQITFYHTEDRASDTRTVVLATVKNSKMLTVNANDLELSDCSASSLAYAEDGKSRVTELSINSDSRVVYNGKLFASTGENSKYSDFYSGPASLPTIGEIKLLDQDDDGLYDIIFIESYETYVVSAYTASNYTIVDNVLRGGLVDNKVVLNPNASGANIEFLDEKGNQTTFSAIRKGSVVCIKKSNAVSGGQKTTAIISNKTVSGVVKGVRSGKSVTINSTEYEYSLQAPWINPIAGATNPLAEPAMSDSGVYYLDFNGNVVAYDKTVTTSNQQYGYIMKMAYDTDMDGEILLLNILTSNGKKTKYYAHEKTKLNGNPISSLYDLKTALTTSANLLNTASFGYGSISNLSGQQLIKFSTTTYKGETIIEEIVTLTSENMITEGKAIDSNALTFFTPVDITDDMKYFKSSSQLQGVKTINVGNAVVFSVPENRDDIDEYSKTTLTNNKNYYVGLFDVSGTSARVVVVYSGADNSQIVSATSPVMVVTEKTQELNPEEDNASMYKLTGYVNGQKTSYWGSFESNSVFATLREGDVVRLGKDRDGYYTLLPEHIVFSTDSSIRSSRKVNDTDDTPAEDTVSNKGGVYIDSRDNETTANQKASYPNPQYRGIWGSVFELDSENGILYVSTKILTGEEPGLSYDQMIAINASWFNSAKILRYKTSNGELEIIEETLEGLSPYEEVFIHTAGSAVKTLIVVSQ